MSSGSAVLPDPSLHAWPGRSARGDPHRRVHEIGLGDALVAALADRLGGIVYTCDPQHLGWLRDAGARITVVPVPF